MGSPIKGFESRRKASVVRPTLSHKGLGVTPNLGI